MAWAVSAREIDRRDVRDILVRITNWVGDAVMCLPALDAVRKNFPDSVITVLARSWVVPLLKDHPGVDRIIPFDKNTNFLGGLGETGRIVRTIRKGDFDMALLFQNAFEAAFIAWLGGVPLRVGYDTDGRGRLLTHRIPRESGISNRHQVEYYLGILRAMGWEAPSRDPVVHLPAEASTEGLALLEKKGVRMDRPLVGLGPGAMYGGAKRWPPDRFARVADWAAERWRAEVLVLGSRSEADICRRLIDGAESKPYDLCGETSLGGAMGIVSRCRFFLTNDSGLMHVAAALGVPTLAVFGPTNPVTTGPRGPGSVVIRRDFACAPCLKRECPTDHRCMLSMEPQEVWEKMEKMMELEG